jgi:hypothetical protein
MTAPVVASVWLIAGNYHDRERPDRYTELGRIILPR